MKEEQHLHKEKFQLERIALFSDAVFAIAITLLVIELKIPEVHLGNINDEEILNEILNTLLPKFIGFLVSFFVIGIYWMVHHRMFGYLIHYNRKLIWNNLLFLLSIVLMPFSSGFLSEYFIFPVHIPLVFYTMNIFFSGFMNYRLWKIIASPKYHLSEGLDNKALIRYNITRAFYIPGLFIIVLFVSFFSAGIAPFFFLLMPIFSILIRRHYKKKYPEMMAAHLS